MKSMVDLAICVLADAGTRCSVSTSRDIQTVASRCRAEGVSFLTITLPSFASDLERAVADGRVDSNHFAGFRRRGGLPRFLSGFLRQLFDASGVLLPEARVSTFADLRQVLNLHRKVELPCTPKRERKAVDAFVLTDAHLSGPNDRFREDAPVLWDWVLSSVESSVFKDGINPTHGSGASAERLGVNERWNHHSWDTRLDEMFRWWDYAVPSVHAEPPNLVEPLPARLAMVPKTLKTPRLIAIEPSYRMFVQQGLLEKIEQFASASPLWPIMGWRDQEPNRRLCREASSGSHATIDLSEASDRVSLEHAAALTRHHQFLWKCIMSCRSSDIELPSGEIHRLRKFASMGSALCFPVESMVFTTIVLGAIARERKEDIRSVAQWAVGRVRVYGDDIIVPVDYAIAVTRELESNGLRVNSGKSFWTGLFRESCGAEYYSGSDVTYVKARRVLPTHRDDTAGIVSAVELRNQLYLRGWLATTNHIDTTLERVLPLRDAPVGHPSLSKWSFDPRSRVRFNPDRHSMEIKVHTIHAIKPVDRLDGYGALSKFFWKRGRLPRELDHLERAGRSQSVCIKTGWQPL